MNGIWVRSEDGERLCAVTAFAVYGKSFEEDGGPYWLMGDGCYLAGYKTKEAAIKQLDDIQASLGKVLQPHVYDLRERKVEEE